MVGLLTDYPKFEVSDFRIFNDNEIEIISTRSCETSSKQTIQVLRLVLFT